MHIGVPKEVYAGEQRVALTPETATFIQKLGHEITVESGLKACGGILMSSSRSERRRTIHLSVMKSNCSIVVLC